jgi:uncharacterized protein (DUF1330 family)
MTPRSKLIITLLAGMAIGAGASAANMQAQATKKPAYVTADVEVTDPAGFQAYVAKVPETLKPFNARTMACGKPESKEGDAPKGSIVIIAFDSLADAEKWYSSPQYAQLITERQKASKSQVYIVEGIPQ